MAAPSPGALRHPLLIISVLPASLLVIFLLVGAFPMLYTGVPKGLFPQEDTGRMMGTLEGDQSISFQSMKKKLAEMLAIVQADPAVQRVVGFTGASGGAERRPPIPRASMRAEAACRNAMSAWTR